MWLAKGRKILFVLNVVASGEKYSIVPCFYYFQSFTYCTIIQTHPGHTGTSRRRSLDTVSVIISFEIRYETTNVRSKRSCPKPADLKIVSPGFTHIKCENKIYCFYFWISDGHVRNNADFFKANHNLNYPKGFCTVLQRGPFSSISAHRWLPSIFRDF